MLGVTESEDESQTSGISIKAEPSDSVGIGFKVKESQFIGGHTFSFRVGPRESATLGMKYHLKVLRSNVVKR